MAFFGLSGEIADAPTEEDVQAHLYDIWPENIQALNLFLALATQWDVVVSPDGELIRTGLKYASIEAVMSRTNGLPRRIWNKLFDQMRMMERAALNVMIEARTERQERRRAEAENQQSS